MKSKKLPSLIILFILTSITVIFWIIFSIYHAFNNPKPSTIDPEIVSSLVPEIDTITLEQIKERIYP